MKRIVGIDIGNSTTEAALAEIHSNGEVILIFFHR